MKSIYLIILFVSFALSSYGQLTQDNTIATAAILDKGVEANATIGNSGNINHYYRGVLVYNATEANRLKINLKAKMAPNSGTTGNVYVYIYSKNGKLIEDKSGYIPNASDEIVVSQIFNRYLVDTCFIRVHSTSKINYTLSYENVLISGNDKESNNDVASAMSIPANTDIKGNIGFMISADTLKDMSDSWDFYKFNLPFSDTKANALKVRLKAKRIPGYSTYAENITLYFYDNKGVNKTSTNLTLTTDVDEYNLEYIFKDNLFESGYIAVYSGGDGPKTYTLSYEGIEVQNDNEDNGNVAKALILRPGVEAKGSVGFYIFSDRFASSLSDAADYYRIALPYNDSIGHVLNLKIKYKLLADLSTQTPSPMFWFERKDKSGNKILTLSDGVITQLSTNEFQVDYPLTNIIDTCYFVAYCGKPLNYSLIYEGIPIKLTKNQSQATALPLNPGKKIQNKIGYRDEVKGAVIGANYFSIPRLDTNRMIKKLTCHYRVTKLVDKAFGATLNVISSDNYRFIRTKNIEFPNGANEITGEFIVEGFINENYQVNIIANNPIEYEFWYDVEWIVLGFDFAQFDKRIKIMNNLNTKDVEWRFGDNTSVVQNVAFPEHTYLMPGVYTITQTVFPNTLRLKTSKQVTIKGIQSYTPHKAGTAGDSEILLYGGGLTENTKVELVNNSGKLSPVNLQKNTIGSLSAIFDFHEVEPGLYDLIVLLEGEEPIVFKNGFEIENFQYPMITSNIEGYSILRTGRTWNYNLVLKNTGNVLANGVEARLAVPDDIEIDLDLKSFSTTIDTNGTTDFYVPAFDKHYTLSNQMIIDIIDSLSYKYVKVDTLFDEPFKGKIYEMYIPGIAAGRTLKIPFRAKSVSQANSLSTSMKSFVRTVNIFGSEPSPDATDRFNSQVDLGLTMISQAPIGNTPFGTFLKIVDGGKSALRGAASYAGARVGGMTNDEAFNYAYGNGQLEKMTAETLTSVVEFGVETGIGKMGNIYDGRIAEARASQGRFRQLSYKSKMGTTDESMARFLARSEGERAAHYAKSAEWIRQNPQKYAELAFQGYEGYKLTRDLNSMAKATNLLETNKDKQSYYAKNTDGRGHNNLNSMDINIGTSVDPNEIIGPKGFADKNCISGNSVPLNYVIRFENLPAAPLAAQIVNVYDTLDVNKYDLESFEFGTIAIGDTLLYVPRGLQSYFLRYDMRPAKNWLVGIGMNLNKNTGVAHWQFITLDPVTKDLINDPIAGFLPPNLTAPEGEGNVTFNVKLKENLPNDTEIANKAEIIFDFNEPIVTNIWKNTIDRQTPTGAAISAVQDTDTTFTVTWQSDDAQSKVKYNKLYVSKNNGEFLHVGDYYGMEAKFVGASDSTYHFYTEAVDSVGNRETKQPIAEASIKLIPSGVNNISKNQADISIFPNPQKTGEPINLKVNVAESGKLEISTYNSTGQHVSNQQLRHSGGTETYQLKSDGMMPNSFYLVRVKLDGTELKSIKVMCR